MFGNSVEEIAHDIETNAAKALANEKARGALEALRNDARTLAPGPNIYGSGVLEDMSGVRARVNAQLKKDGFPGAEVRSDGSIVIERADAQGTHTETQTNGAQAMVPNSRQVIATPQQAYVTHLDRNTQATTHVPGFDKPASH